MRQLATAFHPVNHDLPSSESRRGANARRSRKTAARGTQSVFRPAIVRTSRTRDSRVVSAGKSPELNSSNCWSSIRRPQMGYPIVGYNDHAGARLVRRDKGRGHWQAPGCLCRSPDRDQAPCFAGRHRPRRRARGRSPSGLIKRSPPGGSRSPWSAQQFGIRSDWDSPRYGSVPLSFCRYRPTRDLAIGRNHLHFSIAYFALFEQLTPPRPSAASACASDDCWMLTRTSGNQVHRALAPRHTRCVEATAGRILASETVGPSTQGPQRVLHVFEFERQSPQLQVSWLPPLMVGGARCQFPEPPALAKPPCLDPGECPAEDPGSHTHSPACSGTSSPAYSCFPVVLSPTVSSTMNANTAVTIGALRQRGTGAINYRPSNPAPLP